MEQRIDPWSSTQYADYQRLREQFGIDEFTAEGLPSPPTIFTNGVLFGHRGFGSISRAMKEGRPFCVLTGLAPSGRMHFGHKMVIDEVLYYQKLGADIFIAVADIEARSVRGLSLEACRRLAIDEYLLNYIAMGLKQEKCQVYFQSKRNSVKDLALLLSTKTNLSEMKAIYGFEDSTNMGHILTPLVQVGDILHVQLEEYGGPKPTIVPVGVDQDPHIRLTRKLAASHRLLNAQVTNDGKVGVFVKGDEDVEALLDEAEEAIRGLGLKDFKKIPSYKALYINDASHDMVPMIDETLVPVELARGGYAFYPPSSSYHRFITGLDGGKMSSSNPDNCIFLTDTPEEAAKKLKRAKTGGRQTVEEQREQGGVPSNCSIYEMLLYHLASDKEIEEVHSSCTAGQRLCGQCKSMAVEKMNILLTELAEKREAAKEVVDDYVVIP
ncbi:MAG: tryptophan--tRNA ligase [Thermoplasmata archaeon]|nr:tryptophan--tRNA ligase [Thermoplasmata archaeon]